MAYTERLQILINSEINDLYSSPSFTLEERRYYFSLNDKETKIANSIRNRAHRCFFVALLGYFKSRPVVLNPSFGDVEEECGMLNNHIYGVVKVSRSDIFCEFITSLKNASSFSEELLASEEIENVKNNMCLVELGVGSIDYISIVNDFQDRYHLEMPLDYFANVNKIGDVVDIIYQEIIKQKHSN